MIRIVGIYREPECSPGRHRSNDSLLLEQIGRELADRGIDVVLSSFEEALAQRPHADLIVSMCQGPQALAALLEWERAGARIVNSPESALNTYRDHLPTLLGHAGVRYPVTRLIRTAGADWQSISIAGAHWLKRGDMHASVSADVQRIESREALRDGVAHFAERGITHAVVQEHHTGAEVKFYGVRGGAFFHWFFTGDATAAVDPVALQRLGERAAEAAGLDIFGGDIIVEPSGELTVIDLNDWPSFAPCRDAAAEAIADFLMRRVDAARNPGLLSSANQGAL